VKNLDKFSLDELANYMRGFKQNTREWILCNEELIRRRTPPPEKKINWPMLSWITGAAALVVAAIAFLSRYYGLL
jgi:hypothetical protein